MSMVPFPPTDDRSLLALERRCGSCVHFRVDFVQQPSRIYGHCKIKPRRGSINHMDYLCPEYDMIEPLRALLTPEDDQEDASLPEASKPRVVRRAATRARPPKPVPRRVMLDNLQIEVEEMDITTFRSILREVLAEELGLSEVELAERWRGGELVLKPGREGLQPKTMPIDTFFRKIVMIRDRLRVLEQKINTNAGLTDVDKVELQQYVTRIYGSLTSFNVLFRHKDEMFVGEKKI